MYRVTRKRKHGRKRRKYTALRNVMIIILTIMGIMLGQNQIIKEPSWQKENVNSQMEVHFLNMGQSDSTLIICDGKAMLIDAGDGDKGTKIQLYLKKCGISKLDYLVLTHPDADHIGGADVIITKFDIDNIFMSDYEKSTKTYKRTLEALEYKNYKWTLPKAGSSYRLGEAMITILGPDCSYDDPNNSSIVLAITHGSNRFLFMGDAEEEAEKEILNTSYDLEADVLKVGHHGSKTSSSEEFLDAVNPDSAVISCGIDNSYGFPHAKTLNNLRFRGIDVYRTDNQGTIVAVSDGNKITWNAAPDTTWQTGE